MSAVISECGTYRYWLERHLRRPGAGKLVFIMANPSTADAENNDPTIRKCIGFAKRGGFSNLVVVNVMAGRATDPKDLLKLKDPVGPENHRYLREAGDVVGTVVCAWGNAIIAPLRKHIEPAIRAAFNGDTLGTQLWCYGRTKDGSPRHPLMLAYTTPLEIYQP